MLTKIVRLLFMSVSHEVIRLFLQKKLKLSVMCGPQAWDANPLNSSLSLSDNF